MKIAFVVDGFPTLSETFVLNQIVALLRRGHSVDVYASRPDQAGAPVHPEVAQYRLLERTRYRASIPGAGRPRLRAALALLSRWVWRIPRRTWECFNLFHHRRRALDFTMLFDWLPMDRIENRYDVVHAHFGPNGQRAVAARQASAFRAPVVTTFHGYDANLIPRRHAPGYYRYLFRYGDLFTVGSDFMRRRILSLGAPPARIAHLPMGVDTSVFQFQERRFPLEGQVNVLTVARLVEVKGVEYLLRAVALVKARHPRVKFLLAGDGPLRANLEGLAHELGITDNMTFLGAVTRDRVPDLHRQAHVFVLPSIVTSSGEEENQPVSVAEAQSSGLPVVATAIGGVPESIRPDQSGILVPPRDPEALADAILWLIDNHQAWGRMGQVGRAHVEESYHEEKLHDRLVDLYARAIAEYQQGVTWS